MSPEYRRSGFFGNPALILAAACVMLSLANSGQAQTLANRVTRLLTDQQPAPGPAPDPAAAATSLQSIAGLVAVDLLTLPVESSSGGFVYRLNRRLGVVERTGSGFGPFITESVLRGGTDQFALGLRFERASFDTLQGATLADGTFPSNATRLVNESTPFNVDVLQLEIATRSVALTGSYGISERLSVGAAVPFVSVTVRGSRTREQGAVATLQSTQSGTATGLGDVRLNSRYRLVDRGASGASVGADLTIPTGRRDDFLGVGAVSARILGIGSVERGPLGLNVNGGFGVGGISRELFWSGAATYAAAPRVTVIGELVGRYLSELTRVTPVYAASTTDVGIESMRWVPAERGLHTLFVVLGAKWNVTGNMLLNGNLLVRADNQGLRARVTPSVSLAFDFQ